MGRSKILTYDLLSYLKERHPDRAFKFVVGGDLSAQVRDWEKGPEIERDFGFVWILELPAGETFVHATQVRDWIAQGDGQWRKYVPSPVARHIDRHGLYLPKPRTIPDVVRELVSG